MKIARAERLGLPSQTRCPVLFLLICLCCFVADAFIVPPRFYETSTLPRRGGVAALPQHRRARSTGFTQGRPDGTRLRATTIPRPRQAREEIVGHNRDLKLGVLLLQLGGPERADDVEGFLYNLFADPDIIRLPGVFSGLQKPLAYIISKRRAPKSRAAYESIGGGSPIVKYTRAQAAGVEANLKRLGLDAKCYVAMRYWHPFTDEALEEIKRDGVNTLVVVPLYPHFSISTSGSSLRVLQEAFFRDSSTWRGVKHTVVPNWYARPGYIHAMGKLIRAEIAKFTEEERAEGDIHVLFSAHGVPKRYIALGDPYQQQIERCVDLIAKEYQREGVKTHLSYQSRVGPVEWLRPYTDDKLHELGQMGVKNLVVVPISFVSEHIETLEEIDIEYREMAEEEGIHNWRRVPALNTDTEFIKDLSDLVMDALEEPTITVSEACALNNCDIESEPMYRRLGLASMDSANWSSTALVGLASTFFVELLTKSSLLHLVGM